MKSVLYTSKIVKGEIVYSIIKTEPAEKDTGLMGKEPEREARNRTFKSTAVNESLVIRDTDIKVEDSSSPRGIDRLLD